MGWSSDEPKNSKKKIEVSSKILIAIIACLVLIIVLILVLLFNIQTNTFNLSIDKKIKENYDINKLISKVDNITYINIEEFAKLVGYEYHQGEYKSFTIEENKCYVQGNYETASFFLNENTVCKLLVNEMESDYNKFIVGNEIKDINGKMYAPIDAISVAFNVLITEKEKTFEVYTLDYLVKLYDTKVISWGYSSIAEQNFENQKSILYGYLIVKKENGLYKIIDTNNTKEIVSDKYITIQFSEVTEEYFVTNSLNQVGIINLDGTTKIEPIYESMSILDKESDLYLIQKDEKYGVVKSGNVIIINPEYDRIGLDKTKVITHVESQYVLYTLIPVCKNEKWGAFDKDGRKIIELKYDGFGSELTTVELNGNKKEVKPVLTIEQCRGVVVKQDQKYKLIDITGKELVSTLVDSIYSIEDEYYMVYNNKELNIIERLIEAGLIEKEIANNNNSMSNTVENNTVDNNNLIVVDMNETTSNIVNNTKK